jgi:polyisoprenoid-binding protein YceI
MHKNRCAEALARRKKSQSDSFPPAIIFWLEIIILMMSFTFPLKLVRASEYYSLDKAHTVILFSVSNFGVWNITGTFSEYDGYFLFSRRDPGKDAVSVTLYAAGIHTQDTNLDEELQGEHFFYAARFPQIRFASTGIRFADADNAEIQGHLDLLGVRRPVTLHVHYLGQHAGGGDNVVGFSADTTIQRTEFGMDYLSPIIGNEVQIHIEARGVKIGN